MELGGREILIALGALLIVAILLDGFRRVRRAGKGKLRVKRRRQPIFEGDDFDEFGSELPGGGARVVAFRDEDGAEQLSQTIKANRECDPSRVTSPFRKAEPTATEVVENSPVADESVLESDDLIENTLVQQSTGELNEIIETDAPVESQFSLFGEEANDLGMSGNTQESPTAPANVARAESKPTKQKPRKNRTEKGTAEKGKSAKGRASKRKTQQDKSANKPSSSDIADDEVIILHLMAEQGEVFQGDDLLKALIANGLRYGSMKIFHRHEREDGSGDVLFSMANSVNPGTFELNAMGEFLTPGVTFMMVLADSEDPLGTFDLMLECIHGVNSAIGGELKDQQRSALSQQTAEHYRQRIMDFNRRRLTANA
jgi:cell division protein ZipA